MPSDLLFYSRSRRFVDAYTLVPGGMRRLFNRQYAPGRADWDLVVAANMGDTGASVSTDDVLGYTRSPAGSTYAATLPIPGRFDIEDPPRPTYGEFWKRPWTHLKTGTFGQAGNVLLYDSASGDLAVVYVSPTGTVRLLLTQQFPRGLRDIEPVSSHTRTANDLLTVGPDRVLAGHNQARLYGWRDSGHYEYLGNELRDPPQRLDDGWTHVVPLPRAPRVLFYNASTGRANFYQSSPTGMLNLQRSTRWTAGWTKVVSFRKDGADYLLFYRASTREGKLYRLNTESALSAQWAQTGWAGSWSSILPGDFHVPAPTPDPDPDPDPEPENELPATVAILFRYPPGNIPLNDSEVSHRYRGRLLAHNGDTSQPEGMEMFDETREMTWFAGAPEFVHSVSVGNLKLGKWEVTVHSQAGQLLGKCEPTIDWHGFTLAGTVKFQRNRPGCSRGFENWP